ncbi:hypothetical protein Godav_011515, partial [Gossypium davidsonii]|nr:hypothetical protein [Gossypium davidsonii]MBA0645801.1 hypothetical protein [Gossypium klotzschianum]
MSSSPSPRHFCNSNGDEERPRFFNSKAKSKCWANAETVPGCHP